MKLTRRLSLVLVFVFAVSAVAQPVLQEHPEHHEVLPPSTPVAPDEEPQRSLPVFTKSGDNVTGNTIVDGTHGQLILDGTSPWTTYGAALVAEPSWPQVGVRLGSTSASDQFAVFNSNYGLLFAVKGDGRVGIGTSNPSWRLQTLSTIPNSGSLYATTSTAVNATATQNDYTAHFLAEENVASGVTNNGTLLDTRVVSYQTGAGTLATNYGLVVDVGNSVSATGSVTTAYGVRIQMLKGAGTIGTGYALHIIDNQATTAYGVYQAGADDLNFFAGSLGVGTATPGTKLHVLGTTSQFMKVEATNADQNAGLQIKNDARQWQLYVDGTEADKFQIRDGSAGADYVTVDTAGRVGIGTAAPTARLEVIGDVLVSGNAHFTGTVTGGNIKAKYQDVAEWVPATTDLTPGTVVILNPAKTNEVMASNGAYDTTVAGVVSEQPGLSLGEEGEGKEQIATTGRVKVRVDARLAAIRVGDLLVTSDVPGTAMKSEPMEINGRRFHQPGTIIGKALEPLENGVGEILVLLSMQ